MIPALWLALVPWARAEPPRGQLDLGWTGGGGEDYGFVAAQVALVRTREASLAVRGTASDLRYSYGDGGAIVTVVSSGLSVGPAFAWSAGAFSLGAGVGFGGRVVFRSDEAEARLEPDAVVAADLRGRLADRAEAYGLGSFSASEEYLWMRVGGTAAVVGRQARVGLSLGVESTSGGLLTDRLVTQVGPVAELHLRHLRTSIGLRATVPVGDLGRLDGEVLSSSAAVGLSAHVSW